MISAAAPFLFAAVRRGCLEISVVVDNDELVCGGVDRSQPVIQRRADATEYDRIEYCGLPVKLRRTRYHVALQRNSMLGN